MRSAAARMRDARLTLKELRPYVESPQMLDLRLWTGLWLPDGRPLPRIAGGEVKTTTVYGYPFATQVDKKWTPLAGAGENNHWQELARALTPRAKPSETPETPTTTKGLENATSPNKDGSAIETAKEALEREHPGATWKATKAVTSWFYGKTKTSKSYELKIRVGAAEQVVEQTNTANAWKGTEVTGTLLTELREEGRSIEGQLQTLKANKNECFCVLIAYEVEYEEGGATPAKLELAAAKSESAASMALSAQTQLGLASGVSSSAATLSLRAPTQLALAAAPSTSGGTLGLSAPTQLALAGGASSSTASMALNAPTQLPLAAGGSSSAATLGVRVSTQLVLGAGASESAATLTLEVLGTRLGLAPAASQSAATLGLRAPAQLGFTTGQSFSSATLGLRAPTQLGLGVGASTSSATLGLLTSAPTVLGLSPASSTSAARLTLFTAAPLVGLIFGQGGTVTLVGFGVGGTGASPSAAGGTEGPPLGVGGVAAGGVGLGAIYWANQDIGRAELDGTGVTDSFIANGDAYGVATAPGAIFALLREAGLNRYPLSGAGGKSDGELSPAWYGPNILAADDTFAYYGSKSAAHIERVRLDLTPGSVQVLVTGVNPRGIAVGETKIFWTEWEGETTRIFTAPKAGGAKTELPLPGFPEETEPWGILVVGEHLFFSTVGVVGLGEHEGRIWRCGLDGTGLAAFVPIVSAHSPEWVLGSWAGPLATDGTFLYYGSMGALGHQIGRIGLDDTGQTDFWLDVGEFVFALAVTLPGEPAAAGIASGAGGSLAGVFGSGGNR